MHLAGDALAFGHDRQLAKARLEPRVLDRDRSLVGERRQRLELVDLEAALDVASRRGAARSSRRRAGAAPRGGRPRGPAGRTGRRPDREAARPVDRVVRPRRGDDVWLRIGPIRQQDRQRRRRAGHAPGSTIASRISSRSSRAAIATLTRCRARADASRRSRLAFLARSSADSASIRRKAMAENVQARIATRPIDDDRVDREREQAVEQAVADELDDRRPRRPGR